MPASHPRQELFANTWPWWVNRKVGEPKLLETEWPSAAIGAKYGTLIQGSGTGASVARSTTQFYGGSASVALTSGNVANDLAEIKITMPCFVKGLVSFEQRWIPGGNALYDFGVESRTANIVQARVRYDVSDDHWRYENPNQNDVYLDFSPPIILRQPVIQAAGDEWGWARLVVDVNLRQFVSFEAAGQDGELEFREMTGIPMRDRADGVGTHNLLFFGLGVSRGASNQTCFTTDWGIGALNETIR